MSRKRFGEGGGAIPGHPIRLVSRYPSSRRIALLLGYRFFGDIVLLELSSIYCVDGVF